MEDDGLERKKRAEEQEIRRREKVLPFVYNIKTIELSCCCIYILKNLTIKNKKYVFRLNIMRIITKKNTKTRAKRQEREREREEKNL